MPGGSGAGAGAGGWGGVTTGGGVEGLGAGGAVVGGRSGSAGVEVSGRDGPSLCWLLWQANRNIRAAIRIGRASLIDRALSKGYALSPHGSYSAPRGEMGNRATPSTRGEFPLPPPHRACGSRSGAGYETVFP